MKLRSVPFDNLVVDKSIDSMSLMVEGPHQGKESVGLIKPNLGANRGANQKYKAAERPLDDAAARRVRATMLTRASKAMNGMIA